MIDRITFTGADDSVTPNELLKISAGHPKVEWGILISKNNMGTPRFPSAKWINELMQFHRRSYGGMKISTHICGIWVKNLIGRPRVRKSRRSRSTSRRTCRRGSELELLETVPLERVDRVQLNFHASPHALSVIGLDALRGLDRQVIFQMDGTTNDALISAARFKSVDAIPLFDISGGRGISPDTWPEPFECPVEGKIYSGYAGGLGPENLESQIKKILEAAGDARIWIDMETKVRSNYDRQFDLGKVNQCLEIFESIAGRWIKVDES